MNTSLLQQVEHIVRQAGCEILLPAFASQSSVQEVKQDGSIVTETDHQCQTFIQNALHNLSSDIGFLGEEMSELEQLDCLSQSALFWCVDPLDGTGNFATPMPLFGISVALIDNGTPVLACIYDPIRDEIFSAEKGQGVRLNGSTIQASSTQKKLKQSIGFVDFKRLSSNLAENIASHSYYRSQRNLGTCALEWAWLATGRAQFIVHGGQKIWDYAAGVLLAEEAGCMVTDFQNQPPFGKTQISYPILATANPTIHDEWLSILQS